jgi:hypothetical protein
MKSQRNIYMRSNARTEIVINLIVGQQAINSGKKLSAADALWEFVRQHDPSITNKAIEILKRKKAESGDSEEE